MRHLFLFGCVFAAGALCASVSNAQVSYATILGFNDSTTGVRGLDATNTGNAILTGSQQVDGATQGMLWSGNVYTGVGSYYTILPSVTGTLASSIYHGPDTPVFNSAIPTGEIRAVGTYQLTGTTATYGFMYTGSLVSGTAAVTDIDVPTAVNTIPHSTAGNIVVGDYDLGSPTSGNAFIYSITSGTYQTLTGLNTASLYGVWQSSANTHIVAGGAQNPGIGVYSTSGTAGVQTYTAQVSAVPEPAVTGLVAAALSLAGFVFLKRAIFRRV